MRYAADGERGQAYDCGLMMPLMSVCIRVLFLRCLAMLVLLDHAGVFLSAPSLSSLSAEAREMGEGIKPTVMN